MEEFYLWLFWPLLGALIGVGAAQKRGFSITAGVLGGVLLGPLFAFLMFFATGVTSMSDQRIKCPFCAEWIQHHAIVCPHCQRDLVSSQSLSG